MRVLIALVFAVSLVSFGAAAQVSDEEAAYNAVRDLIFDTPGADVSGQHMMEPREDAAAAIPDMVALSESGNPFASNMLSIMYRNGIVVSQSPDDALHYVERAMNQSRALGDEQLIEANTFNYAATLSAVLPIGDPDWQWVENLARSVLHSEEDEIAFQANGLVGVSILLGEGNDTRMPEAEPYLRAAAAAPRSDRRVIWLMARALSNGWFGYTDDVEACDFFARSAAMEVTEAYWSMGMCLLNYSTATDRAEQAFTWVRRAAEAGDTSGYLSMGVMYAIGQGVQQSPVRAAEAYEYVARQNGPELPHALRALGGMYAVEGYGDDVVRGYALLEIAVELGDEFAVNILERFPPPETIRVEIAARKPAIQREYGL